MPLLALGLFTLGFHDCLENISITPLFLETPVPQIDIRGCSWFHGATRPPISTSSARAHDANCVSTLKMSRIGPRYIGASTYLELRGA